MNKEKLEQFINAFQSSVEAVEYCTLVTNGKYIEDFVQGREVARERLISLIEDMIKEG
jgi:hypothetical protein